MERTYSKLDTIQIQRKVFDEEDESNRVKIINTEMEINVSAEDGDSVYSVPLSLSLSEGIHPVPGMKTICKYGECVISVSPSDDGEDFHVLTVVELEPKAICARRLKIDGAGLVVVQSV